MIVLHASLPIDPDKREEALELAEELVEQSNQEPGVREYSATIDIQDENTIRFFEHYVDGAAFEAHTQSEHFQKFEERLPDILAGEPEIIRFDIEKETELEL